MNPISNVKGKRDPSGQGHDDPSGGARSRGRRGYSSALRAEQAEETRTRIIEALARTLARGVAELTIPAVADEAGVSIPTVYRHFGSKRELVDALGAYVIERSRLMPETPPDSVEAMQAEVREIYRRHDEMDLTVRAAMASELGGTIRREHMPERLAMMRGAIRGSAPELGADDVDRLAITLVLLFSSATMRAMKDYFELTGDAAADHVAWAVGVLMRGASRGRQEG